MASRCESNPASLRDIGLTLRTTCRESSVTIRVVSGFDLGATLVPELGKQVSVAPRSVAHHGLESSLTIRNGSIVGHSAGGWSFARHEPL